jgi:hypothetical protein
MMKQESPYIMEHEKVLAQGLREVASELRLVEPVDYAVFVRTERFANIANLVASSAELYFKPGTILFGQSGEVDVTRDRPPSVALDMEFRHLQVNVFFRLTLEARRAGIDITHLTFGGASDAPQDNTRRLIDAISDARPVPITCPDNAATQRL